MLHFKELSNALNSLNENMSNIYLGATSLDDLKPVDERIRKTRESLKHLNARLLLAKAQKDFSTSDQEEVSEDHSSSIATRLHKATANALINNAVIKSCLHSYSVQTMFNGKQDDNDLYKYDELNNRNVYTNMCKLFDHNDGMLALQEKIEEAFREQLRLKTDCRNALLDYRDFLKEQEEAADRNLIETQPEIAENKAIAKRKLRMLNTTRKLVVNLIAAYNEKLLISDFLVEMLEKYENDITMDQILRTLQSQRTHETESENTDAQTESST